MKFHLQTLETAELPNAIAWEKIRIDYWSKQWNGDDQVLTSQLKLRGYEERLAKESASTRPSSISVKWQRGPF